MCVRVIQCMHVFLYVYLYLCVFLCVCFWKYAQYNNADKLQNYKLMHNLQHIHTQTVTYTHAHIHTHKQTHTRTQSYCAHIFMVKLLFSKLQITNIKFCKYKKIYSNCVELLHFIHKFILHTFNCYIKQFSKN